MALYDLFVEFDPAIAADPGNAAVRTSITPAVLDGEDGPVLPPTPLDFGDISLVLPIEPSTGEDAETIANRRTFDSDGDLPHIRYYPPLLVVPRAWPSQPPSAATMKRQLASQNNQRDRDDAKKRSRSGNHLASQETVLESPVDSDSSQDSDKEDEGDDEVDPLDNTTVIASIMQDLQQPPSSGTNAQALASIMAASAPPNVVVQFVRDAIPLWDTADNNPIAIAFNRLVTLVDYNQLGEKDCVVTLQHPNPSAGYRDPAYRGRPHWPSTPVGSSGCTSSQAGDEANR